MKRAHITTVERGPFASSAVLASETLALFPNTDFSKEHIHAIWPHAIWDIVDIPGNILRVALRSRDGALVVWDAPSYTLSDARLEF
jgi:hypothetical protein